MMAHLLLHTCYAGMLQLVPAGMWVWWTLVGRCTCGGLRFSKFLFVVGRFCIACVEKCINCLYPDRQRQKRMIAVTVSCLVLRYAKTCATDY